MAATVTINDRSIMNNLRVVIGEYTLSDVYDTLVTGLSRSIHALMLSPGYKGGIHVWVTGLDSIPSSSGTATISSNSATYTTGTFMAIGY